MRVVVLADTHIRDAGSTALPEAVWEAVRAADAVLHAGDVVGEKFLNELRQVAPVHAVLGNNDTALTRILPETLTVELGGVRIAMIHDSGPRVGRERRLRKRFPDARVVVFGHSHIPWNALGVDGQVLFNPGSPTQRRRQPQRTFGLLELDRGQVRSELVAVRR